MNSFMELPALSVNTFVTIIKNNQSLSMPGEPTMQTISIELFDNSSTTFCTSSSRPTKSFGGYGNFGDHAWSAGRVVCV